MDFNFNMLQTMCFVVLCIFCVRIHATMMNLENLLEINTRVKDDLALYIEKEEKKLSFVKSTLAVFKREHERAMKDIPAYVGNPINAFTLIKRMTSDLKYLRNSVKIQKANIKQSDVQYPTKHDLKVAALNLGKVLETYEFNVKELVEGKLNGISYGTPMTAGDCFELGRILYKESSENNDSIKYARELLVEAYRKYHEKEMFYPFTEVELIEYISMACSKMGDIESALNWTKIILEVDPEHPHVMEVIAYFQRILGKEKTLVEPREQLQETRDEEQVNSTALQNTYKALCRGNMNISAEISNRLTCYYSSKNHPFLTIAPIKTEMVYLNPDILLFHDVLSNDEIEVVKKMAILKFTGNKGALTMSSGQSASYDYYRNLSVSFHDTESDIIARVSRRVTHITGLNLNSVQNLNIIKYGFGEDYFTRYDYDGGNTVEDTSKVCGKKIGTVTFYMSNVAMGGGTVFPALGLSVFPTKGGAVFWLNVNTRGEKDHSTLHAECPIVYGSKWVASKWLYKCDEKSSKPHCDEKENLVH